MIYVFSQTGSERPDIRLSNDKQWGVTQDNKRTVFIDEMVNAQERIGNYATELSEGVIKLSEFIYEMIEKDIENRTVLKSNIYPDMSINDATTGVCIKLGLSDEDYLIENISLDENYLELCYP